MLSGLGEEPADYEIIAGDTDTDCAAKAVALCAEGKANFLMKGILGTADLMRAVFNKEHGLRTSHLTTHCMFYEIPALGKMVILTDGGVEHLSRPGEKGGNPGKCRRRAPGPGL